MKSLYFRTPWIRRSQVIAILLWAGMLFGLWLGARFGVWAWAHSWVQLGFWSGVGLLVYEGVVVCIRLLAAARVEVWQEGGYWVFLDGGVPVLRLPCHDIAGISEFEKNEPCPLGVFWCIRTLAGTLHEVCVHEMNAKDRQRLATVLLADSSAARVGQLPLSAV